MWSGVFLSLDKDDSFPTISLDSMTEINKDTYKGSKKCLYNPSSGTGHSGHSVTEQDSAKIMEFIQRKISEYGNESDHSYNVIEAMLEQKDCPIDEIEYCIKLHRQGHRVYIPRKEV